MPAQQPIVGVQALHDVMGLRGKAALRGVFLRFQDSVAESFLDSRWFMVLGARDWHEASCVGTLVVRIALARDLQSQSKRKGLHATWIRKPLNPEP